MLKIISQSEIIPNESPWAYSFSFEIGKDDDHKSTVNAFAFGADIHAVSIQGSDLEKAEHWKKDAMVKWVKLDETKVLAQKDHDYGFDWSLLYLESGDGDYQL